MKFHMLGCIFCICVQKNKSDHDLKNTTIFITNQWEISLHGIFYISDGDVKIKSIILSEYTGILTPKQVPYIWRKNIC